MRMTDGATETLFRGERDVIRVTALARSAEELLKRCPEGIVHSEYARTVNLYCGGERLVSVTAGSDELHPFSVRSAAGTFPHPLKGAPYRYRGDELVIGGLTFSLAGAKIRDLEAHAFPHWRDTDPAGRGVSGVPDVSRRGELLRGLFAASEELVKRSELAFLCFPGTPSRLEHWGERIRTFSEALAAGDIGKAASLGETLFGMGWGLTPTFDDFCVGLLAALYGDGCGAEQDCSPLYAAGSGRTNLVSLNFLYHACCGRFTESLLTACGALFEALSGDPEETSAGIPDAEPDKEKKDADPDKEKTDGEPGGEKGSGKAARFRAAAERLSGFGHSSGSDMLAGLLFGAETLYLKEADHG